MILKKYMRVPTNNLVFGTPDLARLGGLASRWCRQNGGTDAEVSAVTAALTRQYQQTVSKEGGVCGGMVCEWSLWYLLLDDPEIPPDAGSSSQLQGFMEMTYFKRGFALKPKAASTAQARMYDSQGLALTKVVRTTALPANTTLFKGAVADIANSLAPGVPHLLTVSPRGGGRHAIGLVLHEGAYYVLEPNEGLFKLPSREIFLMQLTNHFIQKLAPGSLWKLKSIRNK